jgi:hypothetical protein
VLINFERPKTVSEYTSSQLWKLFLSQFVNTALLTYLVNQRMSNIPAPLQIITEPLSIGKGAYYEANGDWFDAVGSALLITVLSQVVSTTITPVVMAKCVAPLQRKMALWSGSKVTYDTLVEIYKLPEWDLALRLAQTMNVVCCVVFYSGGMPLMYFIGVMYCFVSYWLDKYTLLRGSRRPPAYSESVVELCVHFFPIAVLLHAIFAALCLSNQELLPAHWSMLKGLGEGLFGVTEAQYHTIRDVWVTASTEERHDLWSDYMRTRFLDFARESTWLLMLIFLGTVAFYIVSYLYAYLLDPLVAPVLALAKECVMLCSCCRPKKDVETHLTYEEALKTIKKSGMPKNYEMESNEKYRAAAIAIRHSASLPVPQEEGSPEDTKGAEPGEAAAEGDVKIVV